MGGQVDANFASGVEPDVGRGRPWHKCAVGTISGGGDDCTFFECARLLLIFRGGYRNEELRLSCCRLGGHKFVLSVYGGAVICVGHWLWLVGSGIDLVSFWSEANRGGGCSPGRFGLSSFGFSKA